MPPTPLLTSDVLKEENELWPDVQEGMSLALREMRVDQVIVTLILLIPIIIMITLIVNIITMSLALREMRVDQVNIIIILIVTLIITVIILIITLP